MRAEGKKAVAGESENQIDAGAGDDKWRAGRCQEFGCK